MKRYRITNMSDNNIALPNNIRHLIPVLDARRDAIIEATDSELETLRRLAPLGIIITSAEVGVLGGDNSTLLNDELNRAKESLKEKDRIVSDLASENTKLKEDLKALKDKLEALNEEYENFKLSHEDIVKKYKAKLKEAKS